MTNPIGQIDCDVLPEVVEQNILGSHRQISRVSSDVKFGWRNHWKHSPEKPSMLRNIYAHAYFPVYLYIDE